MSAGTGTGADALGKRTFNIDAWSGLDAVMNILPMRIQAWRAAKILIRNFRFTEGFSFQLPNGSRWEILDAKGRVGPWKRG